MFREKKPAHNHINYCCSKNHPILKDQHCYHLHRPTFFSPFPLQIIPPSLKNCRCAFIITYLIQKCHPKCPSSVIQWCEVLAVLRSGSVLHPLGPGARRVSCRRPYFSFSSRTIGFWRNKAAVAHICLTWWPRFCAFTCDSDRIHQAANQEKIAAANDTE